MSWGRQNIAGLSIDFQKVVDLTKKHIVNKVPLPERRWTRENHAMMTTQSQERVKTVLLCAHRLRKTESELSLPHWDKALGPCLPPEIFSAFGNVVTQNSIEEMAMFLAAELGLNF